MFRKIAQLLGFNSATNSSFRVSLSPAGEIPPVLVGEIMTFPTAAQIPQAGPSLHPVTEPSENPCNHISLGFIRQEPVVTCDSQEISGHELMLNNSSELLAGNASDAFSLMHDELLLKSLLNANLPEIAGNTSAFVRLSLASLTNPLLQDFPPEHLILAIHPEIKKADTLLLRCRELKSLGYRFALDDFSYSPGLHPLLSLADFLRFSISRGSIQNLRQQLDQIPRLSERTLVAKNIDSQELLQIASQFPFHHYQGRHFEQAGATALLSGDRPREKIIILMNLLANGSNHHTILDTVKQDSALAGKILQFCNASGSHSPLGGQALVPVAGGLDQVDLYRWLGVLLFSTAQDSLPSNKRSVFESALLLGRLTELFGRFTLPPEVGTRLFATGLLSQLGALFNTTTAKALSHFSLCAPMSRALLRQDGPYAPFLSLAMACVAHDQPGIEHHAKIAGISIEQINKIFVKALVWVHKTKH